MVNRAGHTSTAVVGRLQEARKDLETHLGFPVACSLVPSMRLLATVRTPEERERAEALKGEWKGFPVEVREMPKAL